MLIKTIIQKVYSIIFGLSNNISNYIIHVGDSPPCRDNSEPPRWGTKEVWRHPKLSEFKPPKKLPKVDLGSGDKNIEDWIHVDISKEFKPEVVCDLNFGLPFRSNSIGQIRAFSVLEHLNDIVNIMNEIWRVCADGAIISIYVPHCRSIMASADPTHRNLFNEESFQYFCRNGNHYWIHESYGIKCCFDLIEETIHHNYRYGNIMVRLRAVKKMDEN